MLFLNIETPRSRRGTSLSFNHHYISIGRSPGNDLVLAESHISGRHAHIRFSDGRYLFSDLGSTNGSMVLRDEEALVLGPRGLPCVALCSDDLLVLGDMDSPVRVRVTLEATEVGADQDTVLARRGPDQLETIRRRVAEDRRAVGVFLRLVEQIGAASGEQDIVELVMEAALEAIPGALDVLLVEGDSEGELTVRAAIHRGNGICGRPSEQVFARVKEEGTVILYGQHDEAAMPAATLVSLGLGSGIAAPLWQEGCAAAVLQINCAPGHFVLSELHLDLATVLAHHASVALQQARLTERLRQSSDLLSLALRSAAVGLWEMDLQRGRMVLGQDARQVLRLPAAPRELPLLRFLASVHADDRAGASAALQDHLRGRAPFFEAEVRVCAAGEEGGIWALFRGRVVQWCAGQPILCYADAGLACTDPGHEVQEDLRGIREAGQQAARLTNQLLAIGRGRARPADTQDQNEVVEAMRPMLARLLKGASMEVAPCDQPVVVKADLSQVQQVLLNLVVNANDALAGEGRLRLLTHLVQVDAEATAENPELRRGVFALLAVCDNGSGMDRATAERIFDPFFTTKGPGQGTGLGLATVYSIVTKHGGAITVHSEPGVGTVFELLFPALDADPAEATRYQPRGERKLDPPRRQKPIPRARLRSA